MAGALRQVLVQFSVLVDDKPLTKLDKQVNKVKDKMLSLARYGAVGFAAAGAAAYKLVEAASAADETLNVIQQTFGKNSDAVLAWSKATAQAMGRSQYSLQRYASEFGAFLEPQFRGTEQDISKMSERLSELAVDLASFYNTSDEEAKMRLFSGLSGETEAVRRLGIDISDTSLSDYNHQKGDNRNLAQLTLQEKTLLRYEKILRDTTIKQGDAIRTSRQWANSLRRLTDQLKDLAVRLGKLLIGPATKLLHWVEDMVKGFEVLTFNTSAWQAATTLALSAVAAKAALGAKRFYDLWKASAAAQASFKILIAQARDLALRTALVTSAFLLLEDLWTFMRGGRSVFGTAITELTGIQRPLDLAVASLERMSQHMYNTYVYGRELLQVLTVSGRVLAALAVGDASGALQAVKDAASWDTSDRIDKTKSDGLAEGRQGRMDAAATAGDKSAYFAAAEGSGRSDEELNQMFLRDRGFALKGIIGGGRAQANDMDVGSGLVQAPAFATMSNADRAKYYGGGAGGSSTKNITLNVNGGDIAQVKRAVREVIAEDDRALAAEVAELSADQENGGL